MGNWAAGEKSETFPIFGPWSSLRQREVGDDSVGVAGLMLLTLHDER